MRYIVHWLIFALLCSAIGAAQADTSRWSVGLAYGEFQPELSGWDKAYDEDMQGWQFSMAYKTMPFLDFGVSTGYYSADGQGLLPLNNTTGGRVEYVLVPLDLSLELQAVFNSAQWLIPYVGGGYSELYYKLKIANQEKREGRASGSHYKAGVKLLLNQLDPAAAQRFQRAWGVEKTLLTLEYYTLDAEKEALDLGGERYSLGLVFEF